MDPMMAIAQAATGYRDVVLLLEIFEDEDGE